MKTLTRQGAALLFLFAAFGLGDESGQGAYGTICFCLVDNSKAGFVPEGYGRQFAGAVCDGLGDDEVAHRSATEGMLPQAPPGFHVNLFGTGLREPRVIRVAPNGDIFVVETRAGQVRVFRGIGADGKPQKNSVFAEGFDEPYGMVFYPAGKNPRWLYVANTDSVVRYAYSNGDLKAKGAVETVIANHHRAVRGIWMR